MENIVFTNLEISSDLKLLSVAPVTCAMPVIRYAMPAHTANLRNIVYRYSSEDYRFRPQCLYSI